MLLTAKARLSACIESLGSIWVKVNAGLCARHKTILWVVALLYKAALDIMYAHVTSPHYAYGGLVYEPDSFKYLLSVVLYILLFACLPKTEEDTVAVLLHLQFIFTLAPMLSIYPLMNQSTRYMLGVTLIALLQIYIVCRPIRSTGQIYISGIRSYITVMMGVMVLFALIIPVVYNGFAGMRAFNLDYVYVIREHATYPPGFAYIQGWAARVVLPFALLMFLEQKRYGLAVLPIAAQVILFMESGHKGFVLLLFVILGVYLFAKTGHLLKLMYAGFAFLCLMTILTFKLGGSIGIIAAAVFAVRAVHGPALNKFLYYECFSEYPKILFSDSHVGSMFGLTYPYCAGSGQIIYAYGGGEFMYSNSCTGYWGDAYAEMGFLGILLMAILLSLVLRGIRSFDNKRWFSLMAGLFSVFVITLNDAPLLTTLFSGGMLPAFLLVFVYLSGSQKGEVHGIHRV